MSNMATYNAQPVAQEESSVWDWADTYDFENEPDFYELQGELACEARNQPPSTDVFSMPEPIGPQGSHWSTIGNDLVGIRGSKTILSPPGPHEQVPSSKRKADGDLPDPRTSSTKRIAQQDEYMPQQFSATSQEPSKPPTSPIASHTVVAEVGPPTSVSGRDTPRTATSGTGERPAAKPKRTVPHAPSGTTQLPSRKVFPIQIGSELFRLSGASLSSDGYHVEPRDGAHFVKLFADAQFFSLPRLTQQLYSSTIYIRIGTQEFALPRDLFSSPGDSPNYFSLGFAIFFSTPSEAFPGLDRKSLLRPPSLLPPSIPNRSAKTFGDLLHILKGYPVEIRNEAHRAELLRDARYFHLKGLEQKLIPHSISYDLLHGRDQIVIRLEDIRQSGISFVSDANTNSTVASPTAHLDPVSYPPSVGSIFYQRPFVDSAAYSLVLEIGHEATHLDLKHMRAEFHGQVKARVTSLFQVIANKMNLPITQPLGLMMMESGAGMASQAVTPGNTGISEDRVKVSIGEDADVVLDGKARIAQEQDSDEGESSGFEQDEESVSRSQPKRTRNRRNGNDDVEAWIVSKAQWQIRVRPASSPSVGSGMEVVLHAVKIVAFSSERARNANMGFL
ncbi:hypothetical protein LTR66_011670 [Elasticomyces elasticus]|nr:hypothetical protein LTR66_011670 [Elasticomyces elasticus]